ncbi:MAG: hypothetical protein HY645_15005 [Acidobacteria bacterium]|nr:hypothetical protein [Acidobacteriota bacterium]
MDNESPVSVLDKTDVAARMELLTVHMILVEATLKSLVLRLEAAGMISTKTDEKGWD